MRGRNLAQTLKTFGLRPGCTPKELRAAYLVKAKRLHPDMGHHPDHALFTEVKEEYEYAMELLRQETQNSQSSSSSSSSSRASAGPARAHPDPRDYRTYQNPFSGSGSRERGGRDPFGFDGAQRRTQYWGGTSPFGSAGENANATGRRHTREHQERYDEDFQKRWEEFRRAEYAGYHWTEQAQAERSRGGGGAARLALWSAGAFCGSIVISTLSNRDANEIDGGAVASLQRRQQIEAEEGTRRRSASSPPPSRQLRGEGQGEQREREKTPGSDVGGLSSASVPPGAVISSFTRGNSWAPEHLISQRPPVFAKVPPDGHLSPPSSSSSSSAAPESPHAPSPSFSPPLHEKEKHQSAKPQKKYIYGFERDRRIWDMKEKKRLERERRRMEEEARESPRHATSAATEREGGDRGNSKQQKSAAEKESGGDRKAAEVPDEKGDQTSHSQQQQQQKKKAEKPSPPPVVDPLPPEAAALSAAIATLAVSVSRNNQAGSSDPPGPSSE
uniref:J domain-containing protein n=1 Tax=Chromera velia CCMP2878 TaxID=1169474 RepID=A0A0G4H103_9ALVE|eukprot:Cvel_24259.t1-p1 / transcript=Cvel_24259.t1 / gene=Cvel_24259 / organism=Chromera_velia_CCMP2878 / gene_product=hypothetical protein / transcript_product=hypothetical protein / location=Cvel_scaffold2599:5367-8088(-) / protein_length=500 / sequence_SO=supercontig / SO=protein_coding / is_pseudo=false